MISKEANRRLTTILMADVVGYSRLMAADDEGTVAQLKANRKELVLPKQEQYHGRTVKLMGDGALMEFGSVVDAVNFAIDVQSANIKRNEDIPQDQKISYRMGISIGDIIIDGEDIYGDGVNISARLESICEPDCIYLTEDAYHQAENKVDVAFEALGKKNLKNIPEPVSVYRVLLDSAGVRNTAIDNRKSSSNILRVVLVIAVIVAVSVVAILYSRQPQPPADYVALDKTSAPVAEPAAVLPEAKASIAVLPFNNISGDPDQEYFADGMTEDLITDLSKILNMTVIARTSTSGYKGKEIDIREVGEALNVRYVLEGSVRKVKELVRINAQLVDAVTGGHLWAERYDGDLDNIFSLQDQVLEKIVSSLELELSEEERRRLAKKGTDSVAAHDLYLRGLFHESDFSREGYREATQLYEQALSIDPNYALPYTRLANILELSSRNGWSNDVQADLEKAVKLTEKAVILDPQNPKIYWSLGRATARLRTPGSLERGIKSMQRAIDLDPDFADAYAFLTVLYIADGHAEDGLRSVETAMKLNSNYPFWYLHMRGMAHYVIEDYESAIADFEAAAERSPTVLFLRWWLAASYAQTGQLEDAEWQFEEIQMLGFDGTIATIMDAQPIQDPGYLALYKEGLLKAGIPE